MYIAQRLKQENIAEYLIYMWQVEDLIRACGFDLEKINAQVVSRYTSLAAGQESALLRWYADLIHMMCEEGVREEGHLQVNKNVIVWLTDLHLRLLRSPKFPYYSAMYYNALPFIVELRTKGKDKDKPEVETCFDALYGMLMLKLQKKAVGEETQKAMKAISNLLAMLAGYYQKEKNGELELE